MLKEFSLLAVCFNLIFSSIDFSYELKYGDGTGIKSGFEDGYDLEFLENFIKINSNYDDYYFYLELEYSDPPVLGYSKKDIDNIFSKFYIDKQFDKTYFKLGDIYTLYGAGLGLYTFPDQDIDFDNSLRGLEIKYSLDSVEFFLVGGASELDQRTNPAIEIPNRFIESNVFASGVMYDTPYGYGHFLYKNQNKYMDANTVGTYYLGEYKSSTVFDWDLVNRIEESDITDDSLSTKSVNIGYGFPGDIVDVYFEGNWANYNKLLGERVDGRRYYISLGTSVGDMGLTYEYKNYDMAYDIITFSAPPTVANISTSILAARNTHSMNYGDEIGHQVELVGPSINNFNFLGNISLSRRNKAKDLIYTYSGVGLSNYVDDYISENPINAILPGDEDNYIEDLFSESNQFITQGQGGDNGSTLETVIVTEVETNHLLSPSFYDLLSYNDSDDEFISFYPYRQLYGELSGYLNDKFYIKFGFDHYSEIIKHQDTKYYAYTDNAQSDIDNAWNSFYTTAENIIDDRWTSHQNDCAFLIDFLGQESCEGYASPDEYADFKIIEQFGKSRDEYLSDFYLGKTIERKYEFIKSWTIPTQVTLSTKNLSSWTFYLEYQKKETYNVNQIVGLNNNYSYDTAADFNEFNTYFSGSYNYRGVWTITFFYEHEKTKNLRFFSVQNEDWKGLDLSLNLKDRGQLSIFYGSQKGGLVCANGICAEQPGFEDGVKITYRTFF